MRLAAICEIQMGYTARGRLERVAAGGVPTVQLGDIGADGHIDPEALSRFALDGVPERYLARAGDVLFRSRGERNTATVLGDRLTEPPVIALPLFLIRPDRSRVLPEYLAWAINQPPAQRHFEKEARGTSLRMVPRSSLDTLEIDVPPLPMQRAIVELDALAERERRLSERAAQLRRRLIGRSLLDHLTHMHHTNRQQRTAR